MGGVKYRSVKACSTKVLKCNLVLRCFVFFFCHNSWLFEGVERQKAEELLALPSNRVGSFMVRESARERGEEKTKHLLTPASADPTRPSARCYGNPMFVNKNVPVG